jgi:hypothetical protein
MGMMRLIQSKALWKRLEQTRVGILGVRKHRRVGFERDVDRRHRTLLRDGSLDIRCANSEQNKASNNQPSHALLPSLGQKRISWCRTHSITTVRNPARRPA